MRRYGAGKRIIIGILCALVFWGCGREEDGENLQVSRTVQDPGENLQVSRTVQDVGAGIGTEPTGNTGPEATEAGGEGKLEESAGGGRPRNKAYDASAYDAPADPPQITLVMVGDILLHTRVAESGETEEGGYDFEALFSHMKEEIRQADLALVNQEVIIGGAELGVSGYPSFNAPYELGDALADSGFDVILHATNHTLDKGKRGLLNCLAFWEENYPEKAVLGIYGSEEDSGEIYIYEQDGIRIAILNYTYGTNGIALPEDMPYAVDLLEEEKVREDLQRAEELADFTVVCPHWGKEYSLEQTKAQERWAGLFAENGADLVIGTHPHVIEPVEWAGDTLVYYSLGNFVNWTSGKKAGVANRMVGAMARVTVARNEEGIVGITDWGVEPLVCHLEKGFGGVTVYPLEEYTAELAERNEIRKQDPGFSLEYCLKLAEEVLGDFRQETVGGVKREGP